MREQSSNVGTIQASDNFPDDKRYEYLSKFGIGHPSSLHHPGESQGVLTPANAWDGRTRNTVLFGQGYSTNALQLTNDIAVVANKGVLKPQSIIKSVTASNGREEKVNPMSGCLWSLLPFPILLALYRAVVKPLTIMMGVDSALLASGGGIANKLTELGYAKSTNTSSGARASAASRSISPPIASADPARRSSATSRRAVQACPCGSTTPAATSVPRPFCCSASRSMAQVLPAPGA